MNGTTGFTMRTTCRACASGDLHVVLPMVATPPGDHYVTAERLAEPQPTYALDLVLCATCGLAQLPGVVDPELLYRDYLYNTSISLGLVDHFDRYAESVIDTVRPENDALVVDIGSNDGTLLRGFAARGMRVLGVDPAREAARAASDAGLETLATFFSSAVGVDVRARYGPAAIVTANNVFANVDDLDDLLGGIRALLAPGGVFVFETGYFPDLVRRRIIDNIYHEHLSYYAVKPLRALFERHGMQLECIRHEPTKGGSIRGFVRLAGNAGTPLSPGDRDDLLAAEIAGGFDRPDGLAAFAAGVAALKVQVREALRSARANGARLAGYGASVGVTTLLYYFELGEILEFVVDDNPLRHGRFTPGHHLPVLPSSVLREREPDETVILAWRYAEPILAKHQSYLDAGGRFVLPLPEMRVIGAPVTPAGTA